YEMQIFNRWGESIFHSTDLEQAWDGTYDNQTLDNGVYPYYINYSVIENGELVAKTARGAISIIR
ncbi:MAG: gliding motility-associated C-terminal domain-containing protein, partial [Chitinophagales bacterium]